MSRVIISCGYQRASGGLEYLSMLQATLQLNQRLLDEIINYIIIFLIVILALRVVNIPLTLFTFLGGAVAIGVGFGAQNLLNNFISGFIVMAEQPIKIGDSNAPAKE
jgi:small-conductance mechanosensitive channel